MSHAEAVHTLQPAAGATAALVAFIDGLRYGALDAEVRHYARRHLLDTVGVMICGAAGDIANRAERMLTAVRGAGNIPVPGRARRARPGTGMLPGPRTSASIRSARFATSPAAPQIMTPTVSRRCRRA